MDYAKISLQKIIKCKNNTKKHVKHPVLSRIMLLKL